MSPLTKQIIEKLNKEEDTQVLAEVLDFYEYLKQKKDKKLKNKWDNIDEEDPTDEELKLCEEYRQSQEEFIPLESVIKELNLNGKSL